MSDEELRVSAVIPASPNRIYSLWLDPRHHGAMLGSRTTVEPWVGGRYRGFDGYVEGALVQLDTGRSIALTWRTRDFPPTMADSYVVFSLEPVAGGTKITIAHHGLPPEHVPHYRKQWRDVVLAPMKRYLSDAGAARSAMRAMQRNGGGRGTPFRPPDIPITSVQSGIRPSIAPPLPPSKARPAKAAGAAAKRPKAQLPPKASAQKAPAKAAAKKNAAATKPPPKPVAKKAAAKPVAKKAPAKKTTAAKPVAKRAPAKKKAVAKAPKKKAAKRR